MTLNEIEAKYDFKYPTLYRQLAQDGMLDVGAYGPNWHSTVFPKIKDNPTLFLHTPDFELLNTSAAFEAMEELSDPDGYRQIKSEFKFVPFGQNGGGDHYCFFLTERNGDDIPIVFVWHDLNEAEYLAKNLQDYIFRVLLTDMATQDTYNNLSDEDFRLNLTSTLKTHGKYITSQQLGILQRISSRELIDYEIELPSGMKELYRGLLTDIELNEILLEIIPYEKMNTTFEYSEE